MKGPSFRRHTASVFKTKKERYEIKVACSITIETVFGIHLYIRFNLYLITLKHDIIIFIPLFQQIITFFVCLSYSPEISQLLHYVDHTLGLCPWHAPVPCHLAGRTPP